MKLFLSRVRVFCVTVFFSAQCLAAGIMPVNLRCGSWHNPLGIDDPNPRLSWQVVATNATERRPKPDRLPDSGGFFRRPAGQQSTGLVGQRQSSFRTAV